ncbi:MAG: hydrogenase maturation protease [Chloroflexi bacterium]|nr:hydrogenase maturation protease [Chloroflexota bacterium]
MKTLVLGMGNPILSDDSVGIRVVNDLKSKFNESEVKDIILEEASAGGLRLLDKLIGFDKAIIIDAIQTKNGKVGQVYRLSPEDFNITRYATSPHDVNFVTAIDLGKHLNLKMPGEIVFFAIEVLDVTNFSEKCTPEVEDCIPQAVNMVLEELKQKTG